jgi:hypothetical protein
LLRRGRDLGRLIDRLGRRRPDVSIVALVDGPVGEELEALRAARLKALERDA